MHLYSLNEILFVLACVAHFAHAELFTAVVELQKALYAEKEVAVELRNYIRSEEERLEKLRAVASDYERHANLALGNTEYYLANPVNAFLLVKRFTLDWGKLDNLLSAQANTDLLRRINELRTNFPDVEDLNGVAAALLRLQDTYQLNTREIASGILGDTVSSELTAGDCFQLGKLAYEDTDYYHTVLWMQESLLRLDAELNKTADKPDILDYLSFSMYKEKTPVTTEDCFQLGRFAYNQKDYYHTVMWMQEALERGISEVNKTIERPVVLDYLAYAMSRQGNMMHALKLTNELLELEPDHERARNNQAFYQSSLQLELGDKPLSDENVPEVKNQRQMDPYRSTEEFLTYEALCRNEETQVYADKHKLRCRYKTNNHPLLLLAPVKEEDVYLNPWIVIYHDLMNDVEIDTIKAYATPRLNRATVHNAITGELETAFYRVSKSAWLKGFEHPIFARINKRIEAVSGINQETSEDLQVVNYGIGGHYEPHYDFARRKEKTAYEIYAGNRIATMLFYRDEKHAFPEEQANRIATLLFYMSDVAAGGATVFPYIGVKLFPKKGAAAFWFNLYRNGEGIYDTRHAACPVLSGSKWVCNKWMHERGQEFRRPCSLRPDE